MLEPDNNRTNPQSVNYPEHKARMAIDRIFGHPLSDAEWKATKRALLDYARLLCAWQADCIETGLEEHRESNHDEQIQILRAA